MSSTSFFETIYRNLPTPVIVCVNGSGFPIEHINAAARIVLQMPTTKTMEQLTVATDALRFRNAEEQVRFYELLSRDGMVAGYKTVVETFAGENIAVQISANTVGLYSKEYIVFYIRESGGREIPDEDFINTILNTAYHSASMDEAIQSIVNMAGNHLNASRAFIFEEKGGATPRTYEWRAPGIGPSLSDLKPVKEVEEFYALANSSAGVVISNDTNTLGAAGHKLVQGELGARAVVCMPLYYQTQLLGYIGMDDCTGPRAWTREELDFLQNLAGITSVFIRRRNLEDEAQHSQKILQTLFDNSDDIIYVMNPRTYEIVFVNKALANALRRPADEIPGSICWQTIYGNQPGPCTFCPLGRLVDANGNYSDENIVWENKNDRTKKWYYIKSCIIPWIDGECVHLQTGVDISRRKEYEEQLEQFAGTDTMTGVYNRQWAYRYLRNLYVSVMDDENPYSLCFIDLDGLKIVNDTYGHAAGDDMIRQTVDAIKSRIRKSDMLCRWGGDEFLLLLKCSMDKAQKTMMRIQYRLGDINEAGKNPYPLSFSYGLTEFRHYPNETVDYLITMADQIMYDNKMEKRKPE